MNDQLEKISNWVSDVDWGWWPFLSWRPSQKDDFKTVLVLKLTAITELYALVFFVLFINLTGKIIDWVYFGIFLVMVWVLSFLTFKFLFAPAWNRRARRLQNENAGK